MEEEKQELKFCENCKKDVSAVNFLMHNAHCQRNITLCQMCKEPFPKSEIAAHIASDHSIVKCVKCGKEIEQQDAQLHNTQDCTKRLLRCAFCEIEVQADGRNEHEDYCGSRTERCDECGQYVMLKYRDIHLSSNHSFLTIEDFDKQHSKAASSASMYSGLKNFNTNKDEKEPLSMQSHYSPGKRTNDMPQINVNANLGQLKETPKPILRDLYESQPHSSAAPPSGLTLEQLDQLLAMHLAEDDTPSPSYGNSDPEDVVLALRDGIGGGRFLPTEDFEDIDTLRDNDLNGHFGFPAKWKSELGIGEGVQREGGGMLPKARLIKPPEDEASLALPCEFCNELYSADQLLDHQRFCEFTSTLRNNPAREQTGDDRNIADRLFSPELNNSKNVEKNRMDTTAILNNFTKATNTELPQPPSLEKDFDRVIIPCEYCGTPFDSEYIIEHESGCGGFLEEEIPQAPQTPVLPPVMYNTEARPAPAQAPVISYGGERQLGADPQMDYLDDLFLKEAIENSLKDKNAPTEAPPQPPAARSPKVRQIPINVDPDYSRRRHGKDVPPADEELNALNRMRAAKAQHSNRSAPLTAARHYERPSPDDRQRHSYGSSASGVAMSPNRHTNTVDPTGARPKSFARRGDAANPTAGDTGAERQEDAGTNGRLGNSPVAPIPRLRDQTGPRGARPSSTPAANQRQAKSKQPQY